MAKQQAKQQAKPASRAEPVREMESRSGNANQSATPEGDAEEDHLYGFARVLYHALPGVTAARKYVEGARRAGAGVAR